MQGLHVQPLKWIPSGPHETRVEVVAPDASTHTVTTADGQLVHVRVDVRESGLPAVMPLVDDPWREAKNVALQAAITMGVFVAITCALHVVASTFRPGVAVVGGS